MLFHPSSASLVQRAIRRGVSAIRREGSWKETLLALTLVALVLQVALLAHFGTESMRTVLTEHGGLQVEVRENARDQDIQEFYAALKEVPFIEGVAYVSRQQALERERLRNPGLVSFIEESKLENPFSDSFAVTLSSLASYQDFVRFLEDARWKTVVEPSFAASVSAQEQDTRHQLQVVMGVRLLTGAFIALSVLALAATAAEFIRRLALARRKEVMLETLLGATPADLKMPFVAEMAILVALALIAGGVIALLLALLVPLVVPTLLSSAMGMEWWAGLKSLLFVAFPFFLLLEIVLAPGVALAAATFSIGRLHSRA